MTYKPAAGGGERGRQKGREIGYHRGTMRGEGSRGAEARMYTRGGREGEDSGRTAVPRSRWMLEGLFAVRGRQEGGREKEGCGLGRYVRGTKGDVTHARGTVNASAIRQTHETPSPSFFLSLSLPPSLPPRISNAPNFPIATPARVLSLSLSARDVPFTTPAYPSAGRCVQFARC